MKLIEFVPTSGFPNAILFPLVVAGLVLLCVGISALMRKRAKEPKPFGASFGGAANAFFLIAIVGIGFSFVAFVFGSVSDDALEDKAEFEHYAAQAEQVLDSYPSLREGGVELIYSSYGTEKVGNLKEAIRKQGSFVPLGIAYERAGSGVESYAYVMTLNEDWTLEIFQATEGDQLVKVEPATP